MWVARSTPLLDVELDACTSLGPRTMPRTGAPIGRIHDSEKTGLVLSNLDGLEFLKAPQEPQGQNASSGGPARM